MYLIETKKLSKIYSGKPAVNKVNMHIPEGTIYGFVGENGSGKTTIMRLLTGLAEPSEGSFTLFGVKNTDSKIYEMRKKMSAIVETTSLVPSMTARDNMIYQEYYLGIKLTEEKRQELLKLVKLDKVGNKKVKNYSLGVFDSMIVDEMTYEANLVIKWDSFFMEVGNNIVYTAAFLFFGMLIFKKRDIK